MLRKLYGCVLTFLWKATLFADLPSFAPLITSETSDSEGTPVVQFMF
jgi:hypothetical protein